MDQTISAHQNIFWHYRERSENSNLDYHQRLYSWCDSHERTRNRSEVWAKSCKFSASFLSRKYSHLYKS